MPTRKLNKVSSENEDTDIIVLLKTGIFVPLFFVSSISVQEKGRNDVIVL